MSVPVIRARMQELVRTWKTATPVPVYQTGRGSTVKQVSVIFLQRQSGYEWIGSRLVLILHIKNFSNNKIKTTKNYFNFKTIVISRDEIFPFCEIRCLSAKCVMSILCISRSIMFYVAHC